MPSVGFGRRPATTRNHGSSAADCALQKKVWGVPCKRRVQLQVQRPVKRRGKQPTSLRKRSQLPALTFTHQPTPGTNRRSCLQSGPRKTRHQGKQRRLYGELWHKKSGPNENTYAPWNPGACDKVRWNLRLGVKLGCDPEGPVLVPSIGREPKKERLANYCLYVA